MASNSIERSINLTFASVAKQNIIGKSVPLANSGFNLCAAQIIILGADPANLGKLTWVGSNDGSTWTKLNNGSTLLPYEFNFAGGETSIFMYVGTPDGANAVQYLNIDFSGGAGPGLIKNAHFSFSKF